MVFLKQIFRTENEKNRRWATRIRNLSTGGWELRGKGEEEGDKIIQWEGGRREKGKKLSRGRVVVKGGKLSR